MSMEEEQQDNVGAGAECAPPPPPPLEAAAADPPLARSSVNQTTDTSVDTLGDSHNTLAATNIDKKNDSSAGGGGGGGGGGINFDDPTVKAFLQEGAKNMCILLREDPSNQQTFQSNLAYVTAVVKMSNISSLDESPIRIDPWLSMFQSPGDLTNHMRRSSEDVLRHFWTNDALKNQINIKRLYNADQRSWGKPYLIVGEEPRSDLPGESQREIDEIPAEVATVVRSYEIEELWLYGNISSCHAEIGQVESLKRIVLFNVGRIPRFSLMPHVKGIRIYIETAVIEEYKYESSLAKAFPALEVLSWLFLPTDVDDLATTPFIPFLDFLQSRDVAFTKSLKTFAVLLPSQIGEEYLHRVFLTILPRYSSLEQVAHFGSSKLDSLQPLVKKIEGHDMTVRKTVQLQPYLYLLSRSLIKKLKTGENDEEVKAFCTILDTFCNVKIVKKRDSNENAIGSSDVSNDVRVDLDLDEDPHTSLRTNPLKFMSSLHPKIHYHLAINAAGRLLFEESSTTKCKSSKENKKAEQSPSPSESNSKVPVSLWPVIFERIGLKAKLKETKGGSYLKEPESGIYYALRHGPALSSGLLAGGSDEEGIKKEKKSGRDSARPAKKQKLS